MGAPELIDEHVSANQCKLAVEALLKHEKRREEKQQDSQLLPGKEQHVWLQVAVKQMHPEKKLKPHKIPLAHPLVDPRTSPVCLITKDPQREYKDLLETNNIRFISRVVGVTKLKGKFKPFEARRMLLKENDLFLADERVVPLLPGLLGKKFFEAKKQPIPVCLTRKDLKGELERAITSTYFHQNQGTCSSIKIGVVSHPSAHVLANLKTALPAVAKAIKGGWENIQSLHIKTSTSTSLPIWSCDLGADAGGRWHGLVEEASDESEGEASASEEEAEVAVETQKTAKAKGKKRAAEDEDAQPTKKRAKAASADAPSTPAADGSLAKKKRKTATDAPATPVSAVAAPARPVASEGPATPPAQGARKKRKQGPAQPEPSTSAPAAAAATPAGASKKKSRAHAADFFADEQAQPAGGVAPPPNTPADGLKAGKKGKRAAAAEQTPVRGAIARLGEEQTPARAPAVSSADSAAGDKPSKKAKGKQPGVAGADAEGEGEKKLKKKAKGDDKPAESPAAATPATVSVEDVKRKRGASGLEKKKEKVLKVKRSAKEALIGKKGL